MSTFVIYTAQEGDRWDSIAYKAYGDVKSMHLIMNANKDVSLFPHIPEGTKIRVPVTEKPQSIDPRRLPPWKR